MTLLTRREWHTLMAASLMAGVAGRTPRAQPGRTESRIAGVLIGAQSYSFRDRDLQGLIDGMVEVGITSCELWQGHVEPRELGGRGAREELRRWRTTVGLDHFTSIRERFERAGLTHLIATAGLRQTADLTMRSMETYAECIVEPYRTASGEKR